MRALRAETQHPEASQGLHRSAMREQARQPHLVPAGLLRTPRKGKRKGRIAPAAPVSKVVRKQRYGRCSNLGRSPGFSPSLRLPIVENIYAFLGRLFVTLSRLRAQVNTSSRVRWVGVFLGLLDEIFRLPWPASLRASVP